MRRIAIALREQPLGSWLLGSGEDSAIVMRVRVRALVLGLSVLTNAFGFGVVVLLVTVIIPGPSVFGPGLGVITWVLVPVYVVGMWVVGATFVLAWSARLLRGATEGRRFTERERLLTLRMPTVITVVVAAGWLVGGLLFSVLYGIVDPELIPKIAGAALFSGIVTCGCFYLLCEFAMRPLAARALVAGVPGGYFGLGVTARTLCFWAIGSAMPVLGLMIVTLSAVLRHDVTMERLAVTVLGLGGVILVAGAVVTWLNTRATMAPIRTVRTGLSRVQRGDLSARVVVFDGTELGKLQAEFNEMVAGLAERERVRDVFSRHVGEDVAEAALSQRLVLGGELREVAVLFVDVLGSSRIAADLVPTTVMEVLNRFFAVVVDEVDNHGGFVNKFLGDAALAIFGAPAELDNPAGRALAAARSMGRRLAAEVPELSAGIGVSAGQAVAGYVGAESRFEYTVIGDPVNEAARLTELAKSAPGNVAVSTNVLDAATDATECHRWRRYKTVKLRGRTQRTTVAVPVDAAMETSAGR